VTDDDRRPATNRRAPLTASFVITGDSAPLFYAVRPTTAVDYTGEFLSVVLAGRYYATNRPFSRHVSPSLCVAMIAAPWQPYCDRQLNNVDFASKYEYYRSLLHCALNLASQSTQCIVIGPVCVCVCGFEAVCLFVGLLPR